MIICTLEAVLKRKDRSRYWLHKKSGVTYPTIHALYHNKTKFYSAKVLHRLCAALDCPLHELLKWDPKRFPRLPK